MDLSRRSFIKGTAAAAAGVAMLGVNGIAQANAEAAPSTQPETEAAPAAPVAPGDISVTVIDRFVTRPGDGEAFLAWFMENHAPYVEASALTHERTLVFPPVWLKEESNTIEIMWQMQGSNMFWGAYTAMRANPDWLAFWKDAKDRVISHDRMFCGNAENLEAMNHV